MKDEDLFEHLRDSFLKRMPDVDKLFIKFYKVKSGIKRHSATLGDIVKVFNFVVHSSDVIKYLSLLF